MTLGECGSYTGFRQRMAPDNAGARSAPTHPGSAASSLGKYLAMRPHNAGIAAAITRNFAEANEAAAHRAARACGIDMDELRSIVPKLRHIRDKTHFHIDKRTVEDPAMV